MIWAIVINVLAALIWLALGVKGWRDYKAACRRESLSPDPVHQTEGGWCFWDEDAKAARDQYRLTWESHGHDDRYVHVVYPTAYAVVEDAGGVREATEDELVEYKKRFEAALAGSLHPTPRTEE